MASLAFTAAAVWFGVGLTSGFACLLVFTLVLHAARLHQRRSSSPARRTEARRDRPPRSPSARASARLYDAGREEPRWPVASETTW